MENNNEKSRYVPLHNEVKDEVLQWLGQKIRKRMEELNISISALARMTGIGISTISDYLAGRYEPNLSKIISLRAALRVDWGFFFEKDFCVRGRVIANGLISYWTFDKADIEGEFVKDVWGDSDGKIIGNPKFVSGKFGDACEFNGKAHYIEFDDSRMPSENAPRTLSAWVNLEEIPSLYHFGSVVEWGTDSDHHRSGLLITFHQQVYFVGQFADMQSNGTIELGTWNYVAITYDGEIMKIYINGELDKEGTPSWSGKSLKLDTKLGIGRIGLNVRYGEPFPGMIDEVALYNRALSEEEIKKNFTAQEDSLKINDN